MIVTAATASSSSSSPWLFFLVVSTAGFYREPICTPSFQELFSKWADFFLCNFMWNHQLANVNSSMNVNLGSKLKANREWKKRRRRNERERKREREKQKKMRTHRFLRLMFFYSFVGSFFAFIWCVQLQCDENVMNNKLHSIHRRK